MPTPSIQRLQDALTDDLKKLGSEEVVNDSARKNFTTRVNGTIIEFAHSQPDAAFWTGVKHYASGPRSRFRMRRTPMAPVAETKPAVKPSSRRKAQMA